jgi:hypothetical protein
MSSNVFEGTWEEIEQHKAELTGRLLRVTIILEKPAKQNSSVMTNNAATNAPSRRVSAMGRYAGILSSEDFMRQKQDEIDLEDRSRL